MYEFVFMCDPGAVSGGPLLLFPLFSHFTVPPEAAAEASSLFPTVQLSSSTQKVFQFTLSVSNNRVTEEVVEGGGGRKKKSKGLFKAQLSTPAESPRNLRKLEVLCHLF